MTSQNCAPSQSVWHRTTVLFKTPPRFKRRRKAMLSCPGITRDDIEDLREVCFGISGFADIEVSSIKSTLIITFVEPRISDDDISTLLNEALAIVDRHVCGVLPQPDPERYNVAIPAGMIEHSTTQPYGYYE